MRYRVLGPITAHGEDGPLRLGGPKRCTVLAALLLNANRVVPEERLINLVWGEQPPSTARGGLQVHVSELRALLGKDVVVRRSNGYLIRVEPGELDLHVFDEAVAQARTDFAAGNREAAAEGLRFALDLWNGPPLSGVTDALATSEEPGLEERRLAAVEELFEVELATGRHAQQIGQLRQIADEHPFRERIQAQLMLALHRCGRTPEALHVYSETHRRLVEELGIEPGQQLQELHQRILSGDDQSPSPPAEQPGAAVVAEHVVPAELPHDARGFTGRRDVLEELDPGDGLWVISGPPGVGKTALAVHWAHMVRERFTGGQLYLNLRGFEANHEPLAPSAALTQLLRTLGVTESTMPQTVDEQARLYRSLLADKKVLVLLDNARDTEQLLPLVPSSGTVLITSRNRLGDFVAQTGARSLSLHQLSEEDAQELLRTILGEERVDAEPEAARELARLCDYLPLALRIAAANIGAVPHRRLADGVAELAGGNPLDELSLDGAEESAVTTAFSVSYAALSPERQRLFRLLGLFPGPDFSPVAAAALADISEREAVKGLKALTAANLVEQHAADRYRFHDLVRFFSAEQARTEETEHERQRAWSRLVELYLAISDIAAGQGASQVARLPRDREFPARFPIDDEPSPCLEAEVSNVLALLPTAAKHGPYPAAWYLLDSAGTFLHSREHRLEWLNIAPALLEAAAQRGERRVEAAIHRNSSMACLLIGHVEQCIHHLAQAVRASRESGWRECEAALNVEIGAGLDWSGHLASAVNNSILALELFRTKGSAEGEAMALRTLGWQYRHLGQLELAQDYLTTALERTRAHGLEFWETINLVEFGTTLHDLGRYDEAERCMVRAVDVFRRYEASRMEAWVLTNLSALRCDRGEYQQARAEAAHALDLGRQVNLKLVEADALTALGQAETFLGRLQQAEKYYRMALPIVRHVSHWHAGVLNGLARVRSRMGSDKEALEQAMHARSLAAEQGHRLLEVRAVTVLAEVHARSGAHEEALAAAREALEISGETGHERGKLQIQRLFEELDLPDAGLVVFDCGA